MRPRTPASGYREWIFVGSALGLGYNEPKEESLGAFSHVYINPFGYQAYRESGEFPVGTVLMLVFFLLLMWGSWAHFERAFDFNAPMWSTDSSVDIELPTWPAKLLVPIAFAVLAARLALQVYAYARAAITGDREPVAVPLIQDAATIAANEAQTVSGIDDAVPVDAAAGQTRQGQEPSP